MENNETTGSNEKKLVQNTPAITLERVKIKARVARRTKLRGQIRPHAVNGKIYYSYRRGTDKEIYLGSAENILQAMTRMGEFI